MKIVVLLTLLMLASCQYIGVGRRTVVSVELTSKKHEDLNVKITVEQIKEYDAET